MPIAANRMMAAALALAWAAAGVRVRVGAGPSAAMALSTSTASSRRLPITTTKTPTSRPRLAAAPAAHVSSSHSRLFSSANGHGGAPPGTVVPFFGDAHSSAFHRGIAPGVIASKWWGAPAHRRHPSRGLMTTTATAEGGGGGDTTATDAGTETEERISRGDVSTLDARAVADNLPMVMSHLRSRRASAETMEAAERIASLNSRRVNLIKERDAQLSKRKEQSAVVGKIMRETKGGNDATHEELKSLEEAKALSGEAADGAEKIEEELNELEKTVSDLLASLPNLLDDVVPDGNDEDDNELVEAWGDIADLPAKLGWEDDDSDGGFEPRWHDDVASGLDGWRADEAVKMSGARFVALSGPVARVERALSSFFLDLHSQKHGYVETSVPYVVSRSALEGTSQLPKFEDDLFRITAESHTCNGEDAFLIPTAEVPLTNLHRDSILDESELPLSYVALTPCFRAEAGSYGRDTRGLVRTHQFQKVELVKITSAADSDGEHEALTRHAQACLEALELPYRKVRLCSGDIGFGARHCYDLEVWLPGQGVYKEISSCSNCGDFQAKRMGLRYRPSAVVEKRDESATVKEGDGGKKKKKKKKASKPKPVLCHTINGSGLAVGRALVAVLENYQRPDGSVVVPEVLRPYMGGLEVLEVTAGK